MTNEELIKRLAAMKTCTECQIKGKPCDDNCKWQYEAGNMGEIVQTLEQTIEALEQEPYKDAMSRGCSNCAYYDNGANDEACDGCFADEYEHPNFKPKSESTLGKIRAEIRKLRNFRAEDYDLEQYCEDFDARLIFRNDVEDIIDKYTKED